DRKDFNLYVPLSYGSEDYKNRIIKKGKELFGSRFKPLEDFIPYQEYITFLKNIDILILNHRRQQGMGNTIQALGMGKKVFLNSITPQYHLFKKLGIKVFPIENL